MDNRYFTVGCPAKMSDGRILTDYQTGSVRNEFFSSIVQPKDEYEYKDIIQRNGENIIRETMNMLVKKNTCKCNTIDCQPKKLKQV